MKQYMYIIILAFCLASCNQHSEYWERLVQIESSINERTDSILAVLQSIDIDEFSCDEERAKYALLMSMSLDKNGALNESTEVLQPAIEYYKEKGTSTDQMRTLFYQGRTHHIRGEYARALTCYCEAIEKSEHSDDMLTKARLYAAEGYIYALLAKWDKAIESYLIATDYFSSLDCKDNYVNCLLDASHCYTQSEDYDNAGKHLNWCRNNISELSDRTLGKYYSCYLNYLIETGEFENVEIAIQEYLSNVTEENLNYLSLAYAYVALGNVNKVTEVLSKHNLSEDVEDILNQYAVVAALNEYTHENRNMLEVYRKALVERDSIIYSMYENDLQYMHQKHDDEVLQKKEVLQKRIKTIVTVSCVLVLIIALYILAIVKKRLYDSRAKNVLLQGEKQKYEQLYSDTIAERDALTRMIEDASVKEDTKAVIKERLDVLNKVIISQITGTSSASKKAYQELEALVADKDSFIRSTMLMVEGNNPEFIVTLKKQGLTDEEINICCLYAIGLKGKDIKAYTSQSRLYNKSADIRHKLGLTEYDTNLSIFLREMLEK